MYIRTCVRVVAHTLLIQYAITAFPYLTHSLTHSLSFSFFGANSVRSNIYASTFRTSFYVTVVKKYRQYAQKFAHHLGAL